MKNEILLFAAAIPLAMTGAPVADLKTVKEMPREEAAFRPEFRGRGVVTAFYGWMPFAGIVAPVDAPNFPGVYFDGGQDATNRADLIRGAERIEVGDVVDIDGRVEAGMFAPSVFVKRMTKTGKSVLPEPDLVTLGNLAWGVMDNKRIRIRGVVGRVIPGARGEGTLTLFVHSSEGCFSADVNQASSEHAELVDAEVELEGIAASYFNQRGEFISVHLEVSDESRVRVLSPAPPDPFSLTAKSPSGVLGFSMKPPDSHRRKVVGTVTYSETGKFFFVEGCGHAVKVEVSGAAPEIGKTVEVVGFPVLESRVAVMRNALWRTSASGANEVPVSVAVSAERIFEMHSNRHGRAPEDYSARLVSITGRVVKCSASEGRVRLDLDDGGRVFSAEAAGPMPGDFADAVRFGPMVRVTGVCDIEFGFKENARVLVAQNFRVLMRGLGDIEILPDGEYRRRRNSAFVSTAAKFTAAGLFAVLVALLFVMDRKRRRLAALTKERRRMAGDLHDTIEQYFASANILLQTGLALTPDKSSPAADAMEKAGDLLMHAKMEIRNVVWNLREPEIGSARLADVLRNLAKQITSRGVVKVRTSLAALPDDIARRDLPEYVLIVQEAITNAMKHGRAKTILVTADRTSGGGFSLSVANDGEPFDFEAADSPETGHFGVRGMRQRAAKVGGVLSFSRRDGWVVVKIEKKGRGVG